MPRGYSPGLVQELHATVSADPPLVLLEIDHPDLVTPVRVVNDTQDITSNGGLYQALGFSIHIPDEEDGKLPEATLAIDNIGRELMTWLDSSAGGAGATARLMQVRRSAPDVVEYDITMDLTTLRATSAVVSGHLGYDNLLDRPAVLVRYDTHRAPGLF